MSCRRDQSVIFTSIHDSIRIPLFKLHDFLLYICDVILYIHTECEWIHNALFIRYVTVPLAFQSV